MSSKPAAASVAPPARRKRTLKEVTADFHAALGQQLARQATAATATVTTEASRRQVGGTHYKTMRVQPWDVVDGWPMDERRGYYRGNALKYLMRAGSKDHPAQEIEKCIHYLQKLLEVLRAAEGAPR